METIEEIQSDTTIVAGAQNRASIMAYLNTHPGNHKSKEVSDALQMHYTTAASHLKALAESKQIKVHSEGTAKIYSAKNGVSVAPDGEEKVTRAYTKKAKVISSTKEVELVVYGMQIIIGRNAATGRARIIVEDAP